MGCAVNGPGEAGDADFGIAGGRDVGFIYAHGRVLKKVLVDILVDELFHEIDTWIEGGCSARSGCKMAKPAALAMAEASASASTSAEAMRASQLFLRPCARLRRRRGGQPQAARPRRLHPPGRAGLWSFLPLGWRVHRKSCRIIREEMDAIGGQEMLMPVLTPRELWERPAARDSRRSSSSKDRTGRDFVLR
jgi:hypothetical protein